jgi:hypothetical protein
VKKVFFFDELINCQICEPTDHSTGFGGKFGVQKDRVDKSAVGWEHHEKVEKHESQKGFCSSFSSSFFLFKMSKFIVISQIIRLASGVNMVFKRIE